MGFNPLKSGRFCNFCGGERDEKKHCVSIPLNRVGFVIQKIRGEKMKKGFNPLKSGRFCNE